ncbi:MAG: PilN domain-containing protein [Methylobacter sp.]|nr:PilN domain-containing protein [Methylobacter sp.]
MIQQVNLYQDILNQGRKKSGINLYWVGLSVIALLLVGFSVYLTWNTKNTETHVQQLRQNLEVEHARVNLISSNIPKQEIDTQLAAEVAQWQNMLDELTQTMQLLSDKSTDQSPGFSSYFQALSNQSIPDVWLSALYLDEQQQVINIEGSTFKPEKIPYFLQQLQKEPIFNGYSFAKLIMQQSKTMPNQMDFKLSTTLDAPDKKDHAQ